MSLKKLSKIILEDYTKKLKRYDHIIIEGQTKESEREVIEYVLRWIKRTDPVKVKEYT